MELTTIQPTTRKVALIHPSSQKELGISLIMRSRHSEEVQKAQRKALNARLQKKRGAMTAEAAEAVNVNFLVAAVEGWEINNPEITVFGEREFSPKLFRKLLTEGPRWVYEQVDQELGDDAAFYES